METIKIGIIGGTGVYQLPGVRAIEEVTVKTDYGEVKVTLGTIAGKRVAFLTRHGESHSISPGQINYRANMQAMAMLGVKQIFATACSGGLNPSYREGDLVVIRQFIEFVKERPASFFLNDGSVEKKIGHVDLTDPYCDTLATTFLRAGEALGLNVKDGATYCCMEGPRFETRAEVKMLQNLGCDLVAQTQYPEVALAREAEICYAAVGIVANMAAGICDEHVSVTEVQQNMSKAFEVIQNLLVKSIELTEEGRDCWCQHSLGESYA